MMNGMEKSDSGVVAEKSANKGAAVLAESMERRTEPEGNLESQSTRRAQDRESVTQAADRIGVVCGRGRDHTLSVPAIFPGQVDVFPAERRNVGEEFGIGDCAS